MTCIAAAVNRETGEFVMGGDSSASTEDQITTTVMPKVFQNGEFIIGTAGSMRWQQLLTFVDLPLCPKNADLARYMAVEFPQCLREAGHSLGCLADHDGVAFAEGVFLVAFRGRVWRIQPNLDAFEVADGLAAVGSGESFALAAMKAISSYTTDLRAIVQGALVVSEYYSTRVRGPFTLIAGSKATIPIQTRRHRPARKRRHRGVVKGHGATAPSRRAPASPDPILAKRARRHTKAHAMRTRREDRVFAGHDLPRSECDEVQRRQTDGAGRNRGSNGLSPASRV